MEPGKLTLYRSSAGSGKTFTLARDYLILALEKPEYFRHILAVTFTNKATAEMKMRVLRYLDAFAKGDKGPPFEDVRQALGLSEEAMAGKSRAVLSEILHHYFFFSVQTIDSFFQKVVRSFAREAGLPTGYEIELGNDRIIESVIDRMLEALGENQNLTAWISDFALDSIQDGIWDIRKSTRKLAGEVFKEHFLEVQDQLPDVEKDLKSLTDTLKDFYAIKAGFENEMKRLGEHGLNILEKYHLDRTDFRGKTSSVLNIFQKVIDKDFSNPTATLLKCLSGELTWYSQGSDKINEMESALEGGLLDAIATLVSTLIDQSPAYFTAKSAIKNFHLLGLFSWFRNAAKAIKNEEEILSNQDITEFLKAIIEGSTAPFIYEKIGTRYHHYLLDEFQDTSALQWQNMKPLLQNSLAEGHANLIVGDPKQSIYRWRSGDYELMTRAVAKDIGANFIVEEVLDYNYRSKADIIGFNNAVFAASTVILHDYLLNIIESAPMGDAQRVGFKGYLDQIKSVYQDVEQNTHDQSAFKGMVEVQLLDVERDGDDDYSDHMINVVGECLESLSKAGVRMGDIGILVRRNTEGGKFIKAYYDQGLDQKFGPVVSSESLFLNKSKVVILLLNAMRYITNPEDDVALANMLVTGYTIHKRPPAFMEKVGQPKDLEQWLPKSWDHQKLRSLETGVLIEHLIRLFRLQEISGEYSYILAFQTAVQDYTRREKGDVQAFLEWWDENGEKLSITVPDDIDAIRLLTIHKSKGLQFKVVMVPYMDWDLDQKSGNKQEIIWAEASQPPFSAFSKFPVIYSSILERTYFNIQYFQERLQRNLDHLNLLYVALTRAEDAFYGFAKNWKSDNKGSEFSHVAKLIKSATQSTGFPIGQWDADDRIFRLNDVSQISPSVVPDKITAVTGIDILHSDFWESRVTIKKARFGIHTDPDIKNKINYGLMVHEVLSRIMVAEDAPNALDQVNHEGWVTDEELQIIKSEVENILGHELAGNWFSKEWHVRNEVPILLPDGKEYRADRVLTRDDECLVIDYKTGQEEARYERQVQQYMEVLSRMGYKNVQGYLLYLDPLTVKPVSP